MRRALAPLAVAAGGLLAWLVAAVALGGGDGARPAAVPALDRARHSVPLSEIVFDTFDGRYVRLSDASDALTERLRDAILPLDEPVFGGPEDASWLTDGSLVLGIERDGEARAYPIAFLDRHELVNDDLGGRPILVSWCPLCQTAAVFDRRLDGGTLDFSNTSALHESDLVMVDRQTGSYWFHAGGEAIAGTLTGSRLDLLPSVTATWGEWRRLHPATRVLVGNRGERLQPPLGDAGIGAQIAEQADAGRFAFPVRRGLADTRLRAGELVLAVEAGGAAKGYPLGLLRGGVVNDRIGTAPVLVVTSGAGLAVALERRHGGRTLTFARAGGASLRDRETGSTWSFAGRALAGPLEGAELPALPSRRGLWFALAAALPGLELYRERPLSRVRVAPERARGPTRSQRLRRLLERP